jgi:hypothetical protein
MPDTVELDRDPEWTVEAIVGREWHDGTGTLYYKVQWEGNWPADQKCTWEPPENLSGASALIRECNAKHRISPPSEKK